MSAATFPVCPCLTRYNQAGLNGVTQFDYALVDFRIPVKYFYFVAEIFKVGYGALESSFAS